VIHQFDYANKLNLFVDQQGIDIFLPIFGKTQQEMPELQNCKLADGFETFDEWMVCGFPALFLQLLKRLRKRFSK
jgi:hypothetical protein